MRMNCLQFALLFWDKNPAYKLYYDGDHVINLREEIGGLYKPIELYGFEHVLNSFKDTLYPVDIVRLKRYFKDIMHDA